MKKLIFLLLFVGFFSNASGTCTVDFNKYNWSDLIIEECGKDYIVITISQSGESFGSRVSKLVIFARYYCRYDREIIFIPIGRDAAFSCVLNSTMPRRKRG